MSKIVFPNIDLKDVKGVLIDIDDTLYSYEYSHNKAINNCYNNFREEFESTISFEDFNKKYREKRNNVTKRLFSQGSCRSRLLAFQAFFEQMNIPHAFVPAMKYEMMYWEGLMNNMELLEDARKLLKSCSEQNIPVCVVSDMQAHFQIKKLQVLGIEQYITFLVTSEEIGEEKPAKSMFNAALKKLNLLPENVVMIGDSEEKDIQGAQLIGIKTYKVVRI